jgi:hypothetical protein
MQLRGKINVIYWINQMVTLWNRLHPVRNFCKPY